MHGTGEDGADNDLQQGAGAVQGAQDGAEDGAHTGDVQQLMSQTFHMGIST